MLDEAGFAKAKIVASNDLDEYLIADLKQQGATIAIWGVGTRLVTAYDQPALGGVYKLSAYKDSTGAWRHTVKLSEQSAKVSVPGILQVRRFTKNNTFVGDAIYDTITGIGDGCVIVDPSDMTRRKTIDPAISFEELLVPIFREGRAVYSPPALEETRQRTFDQLACVHPTTRRFTNPHRYPAGLEEKLFDLRTELIFKAKGLAAPAIPAAAPTPIEMEVAPTPEQSTVAEAPAQPDQPAPPPAPQRPKFAGIGAKFGQVPSGSNLRVRVNPNLRSSTVRPRSNEK
jgi:nicotinate phosphoribosyltransferase